MSETVQVDESMFERAMHLAEQTIAIFSGRPGHYNNTIDSHLRGKLGELACSKWISEQGVEFDSVYEDIGRMREADLILKTGNTMRLDVKTWNQRHWPALGRCISVNQMPALQAKADGIIWCITPDELAPAIEVEIVGWNTLADANSIEPTWTGPPGRRQVHNYQLSVSDIRPLQTLLNETETV